MNSITDKAESIRRANATGNQNASRQQKRAMWKQIQTHAPELADLMTAMNSQGMPMTPRKIETPDGVTRYEP